MTLSARLVIDRPRNLTIGILGSYGGLNIGDEAILVCVLRCLRALRPSARIVVFTRNSPDGKHYACGAETVAWEGVGRVPSLRRWPNWTC